MDRRKSERARHTETAMLGGSGGPLGKESLVPTSRFQTIIATLRSSTAKVCITASRKSTLYIFGIASCFSEGINMLEDDTIKSWLASSNGEFGENHRW